MARALGVDLTDVEINKHVITQNEHEDGIKRISSVEEQNQGAVSKAKPKKKKGRNKQSQSAQIVDGQNSSGNESFKRGQNGSNPKVLSMAERKDILKDEDKVKTEAGFGEGWWKSDRRIKAEQARDMFSSAAETQEATRIPTRLKFKDFYSDSEDEEESTADKPKELLTADHGSASTSEATVEAALSSLQIEKDDSKIGAGVKKEAGSHHGLLKWSRCSHCKKSGYMLNCSRCQMSSYCDKQCQKNDYALHKVICRRKEMFNKFQSKIPELLKLTFRNKQGTFVVSQSLEDLPSEFMYAAGMRAIVMAEITGPYLHIFRYGITIRDLKGERTHILFYIDNDIYTHMTADGSRRQYPLSMCLIPGNFIILLDTHLHFFVDGTLGIRINDLLAVQFIFQN